jgi:hypothetical protein
MSQSFLHNAIFFFLTEAERQIGAAAPTDIINHLREFRVTVKEYFRLRQNTFGGCSIHLHRLCQNKRLKRNKM